MVIAVDLQRRALVELGEQALGGLEAKRLLITIAREGQRAVRCAAEMGFTPASRTWVQISNSNASTSTAGDDVSTMSFDDYLASAPRVN